MANWQDWSRWLEEGYFLSYTREGTRFYEFIVGRDIAHWEYEWPETIDIGEESGPYTPDNLEITRGYEAASKSNEIWQVIFGIKGQVYIYVELPSDIHRHGIPKVPKPGTAMREVSHFEEWMSPFQEPSFITEHIMIRPENQRITLSAYNPQPIDMPGIRLNIFIAKLRTERIGTEGYDDNGGLVLEATRPRWTEVLEKLYKRTIPQRPLTLLPIRAPAEAPSGQ